MKRAALCLVALIAAINLFGVTPVLAQEMGGPEGGFSAYGVSRIIVLDGSVWVRPSDGGDWEEFSSNSPVPPRSRVSVPEGSEAELQFHGGQFVLLTSGTDLEIRDLQEGTSVFRLRAGEIRFDLPEDDFAPVSIRVPGGAVAQFPVPGRQWLTVTDSDETRLVVGRGSAVVTVDGDEHRLRAGQEAVIGQDVAVGPYRGGTDDYAEASPPPEAQALGDAPPVVVSELQEYGEWVTVPAYGYVWRPRVAAGWSPYVYGRWVWISPYGWTWVSNEPWGWYPYRCGYWLTDPVFGWIWSPYNSFVSVNVVFGSNRYPHHNVYFHPATVRFLPEGGNVRWVPLRPGERYRPAGYAHGDARLARWNRPLDSGRVFVRGGADRREWRDWNAVHAERQTEIRTTRAVQPRPDTRKVRPENRAVRPPAAIERRNTAGSPKMGTQAGQPAPPPRSAPAPSPRSVPAPRPPEREKVREVEPMSAPAPGRVEKPAPPPRSAPAAPPRSVPAPRPPEREKVREVEPMSAPAPGRVEKPAPPPRSAPAAPPRSVPAPRPPEREKVREVEPMAAPAPGRVEKPAPPPRSAPAAPPRSVPAPRPPEREKVREVEPMAAPAPGRVEKPAPPPRTAPAAPPRSVPAPRPAEREQVRDVGQKEDRSGGPPPGRSPDPGGHGQDSRGNRSGDDSGRGGR